MIKINAVLILLLPVLLVFSSQVYAEIGIDNTPALDVNDYRYMASTSTEAGDMGGDPDPSDVRICDFSGLMDTVDDLVSMMRGRLDHLKSEAAALRNRISELLKKRQCNSDFVSKLAEKLRMLDAEIASAERFLEQQLAILSGIKQRAAAGYPSGDPGGDCWLLSQVRDNLNSTAVFIYNAWNSLSNIESFLSDNIEKSCGPERGQDVGNMGGGGKWK